MTRRQQLGPTLSAEGVRFAVWSDKAGPIVVDWVDESAGTNGTLELVVRPDGSCVHEGFVSGLGAGALYNLRINGVFAVDPYARSLPRSVHGPAEVVARLLPKLHPKRKVDLSAGEVLYEIHIGAFTAEGTFKSAMDQLAPLAALGVTVLELMPIAAFPGQRGWGYDGVALFAPFAPYGTLQELSAFVDAAHGLGLSVILDVVYNHLGPDGNYLPELSDQYFASGRQNAWGQAPAVEKDAFRQLVLDNARYWLEVVGFDGLRLDAAHELEPGGEPHILYELSRVAQACSPRAILIAEDDRNDPKTTFAHGVDGVWSDDFHHAIHVLLTGEREGYYSGYRGDLCELAVVIERGQIYEGQIFPPTGRSRGTPSADVPRERLIYALQNHDQVGNRAQGERLHELCSIERFHAATLVHLFLPATPLLFMGQERAVNTPFLYFTDHHGDLGKAITLGRQKEFANFAAFREAGTDAIPDPQSGATFHRTKVSWHDLDPRAAATSELYCRALALRRSDPVLSAPRSVRAGVHETVLWVISGNQFGDRLLLLNVGAPTCLDRIAGQAASAARLLLSTLNTDHDARMFHLETDSCSVFSILADRS